MRYKLSYRLIKIGRLANVCFVYLQCKFNLFSVLSTAHLRIVVKKHCLS